jgi:hypothetical protein
MFKVFSFKILEYNSKKIRHQFENCLNLDLKIILELFSHQFETILIYFLKTFWNFIFKHYLSFF